MKSIYMIGIGGIGMSAMARYFKLQGCRVAGYDRNRSSITDDLQSNGMAVHFKDDPKAIPANIDLVIYTPAVPNDHKELVHLMSQDIPVRKRADVLGMITKGQFTIAVAGAHGKTSISALIAHILASSGQNITSLLGGIVLGYDSNFIHLEAKKPSLSNRIFVVEADEYDRSFLQLEPDIAVITAIEPDHLDVYGSEESLIDAFVEFAQRVKKRGHIITLSGKGILKQPSIKKKLSKERPDISFHTYAISEQVDFRSENVTMSNSNGNVYYVFDTSSKDETITDFRSPLPGRYNIENALAAILTCRILGLDVDAIKEGLTSFRGIKRRFELKISETNCIYVDDYAHHPSEIEAVISAMREISHNKSLTVIFQPHLYSRTKDLAAAFAKKLDLADKIILMEIYGARETKRVGVSAATIANKMTKPVTTYKTHQEVLDKISQNRPVALMTLGAGDIDKLVDPITQILQQ